MQLLTLDEAIYLENKYAYLTGIETKLGKVKTLIRQAHEEDANYYKVIAIVFTNHPIHDAYIDLDIFCSGINIILNLE